MEIMGLPAKTFFAMFTWPLIYLAWSLYLYWKMGIEERSEGSENE